MNREIQESNSQEVSGSQAIYSQPPRNQRKYPIPKQVNYFILHNYALRYYNGKPDERVNILKEISAKIQQYGYIILEDELERRFKNMKAHYRRKKEDLETGLIANIEWEYFQILDGIFANMPKRSYQRIKPVVTAKQDTEFEQPPNVPSPPLAPHHFVPKVIIFPEAEVPMPAGMAHTQKRKSDEQLQLREIKKEKMSSPEVIQVDDSNEAVDMTIKKTKVIEFNNINDIAQQLPIVARTCSNSKNNAVKRISEEMKKLDAERLNLDEQRLQLEIKRNEIDKAAYSLTQLLYEIANA